MIDTDKMKAALAATPLCQRRWTEGDGSAPTKLCAISALVSFAGVQPDLIATMARKETEDVYVSAGWGWGHARVPRWVATLALPVLKAVYGIPERVGVKFPGIFDAQENEWRGVQEVLALCEQHNMSETHAEAIAEDAVRFPQHGPDMALGFYTIAGKAVSYIGVDWSFGSPVGMLALSAPEKLPATYPPKQKPGQSKFWTASKKPPVPKLLKV